MLDAPYFENPVGVESVDPATGLIANHIDYLVMLQRRSGTHVDCGQTLDCRNIIATQLVLAIQAHDLS